MFSRKTCDQIHIDIVESQFSCQMENADYIFHCVTSSDHIQCLLLHGLWIDGNSANSMLSDLIMMDGGKGQVNIALEVLDELHISIPVCGMVKDDHHRTRGLYYQNIEIPIDHNSEGFRLITRVQDEAHRFAIEFHRKLRSHGQVHSILDDIPGIGPARRKALMRTFASLDEIKNAEVEDLKKIPSMDEKSAKNVYNFFRGSEKEDTEAILMEEQ